MPSGIKNYKEINVLPAVTTTYGSDWREKIREIKKFRIREAALFPTCLNKKERKEMYVLLENSGVKRLPFVHLRGDMTVEEMDYFVQKYETKAFNIHMQVEYPMYCDCSKYAQMIFIENVYHPYDLEELKKFGGICLDLSHLETDRLLDKTTFEHNKAVMKSHRVGCNHISAIKSYSHVDEKGKERHDYHQLKNLSELDYLKNYTLEYFSPYVAIELENTIEEQLEARKYITKILAGLKAG